MRRAFDSELIGRVRSAHDEQRELPLVTVRPDEIMEGYVDLVFEPEAGEGWVLVDYKTDRAPSPETLRGYEEQVRAYARMFEQTGTSLAEAYLLLTATGDSYPVSLG